MTPPIPPIQLPDADLWEYYRGRGLSVEDATLHVERRRSSRTPAQPQGPGKLKAFVLSAAQGIRPTNRPEALQALNEARVAQPGASVVGNILGMVGNPLNKVLPAPTSLMRGVVTGGVLGAVQGGAEAGKPGAIGGGIAGATIGGPAGRLVGKPLAAVLRKLGPVVLRAQNAILQRFGKAVAATPQVQAMAGEAAEVAVRDVLRRDGHADDVIEDIVQTMRRSKQLPTPQIETPVAQRPGETVVRVDPQKLEVHGTRVTPPEPTTPTILEMQEGRIGQPAIPGKPEMGTLVPAGPRQKAGSRVRTQSPKPPSTLTQEQTDILLAMSPEEFKAAKRLIGNKAWNAVAKLRRKK